MARNIVICSDGTGNTANKDRGTNVFKVYEAVDLVGHKTDPKLDRQIVLYDDGVGTQRFKPLKLFSGAVGFGLSRNVRELYLALAQVYEPGDRIFLFGFSRGAFTVRTLGGLIASCGIVDRRKIGSNEELVALVKEAYRSYRYRYRAWLQRLFYSAYDPEKAREFRLRSSVVHPQHAPDGQPRIAFIGVWDTVAAVGLPLDYLADAINAAIYQFKFNDRTLSKIVERARHALSIDDERHTFHPVLWDERGEENGRIEQVWFPGVHSNVGGGYPRHGMSLVSLCWMMTQANGAGLRFNRADHEFYCEHQNADDKLYDSRAGLRMYYRYKPRDIARLCRVNAITPKLHLSAIERIAQGTEGYAPGNLARAAEYVESVPSRAGSPAAHVATVVRAALGPDDSLLARTRGWTLLRCYAHHMFAVFSVVAIVATYWPEIRAQGIGAAFSGFGGVESLVSIAKALLARPWLLAVILLFYVLGRIARRRMEAVFSRFWHDLRPSLNSALAQAASARVSGVEVTGEELGDATFEPVHRRPGPAAGDEADVAAVPV